MGNRYGARPDEFAWTLGVKRRLKRYLHAGLSYAEIGTLLGVSRGSVSAAVARFGLSMTVTQQREWRQRQAWERAKHGRRSTEKDWDSKLVETWAERKERKKREAMKASPSLSARAQDSRGA